MATYYVWSGTGGTPGTPWAAWDTAALTLAAVMSTAAAGEIIYVAHDHAESGAGVTITPTNGTSANPIKIICGTRSGTTGTGISGLATTATIESTNTTMSLNTAGFAYFYGITFKASSASSTELRLSFGSTSQQTTVYDNCTFWLSGTSSGSRFVSGNDTALTYPPYIILRDCWFKGNSVNHGINVNGFLEMRGGGWLTSANLPTLCFLMGAGTRGGRVDGAGIDFSVLGTTFSIFGSSSTTTYGTLRNCKLPSAWAPTGVSGLHNACGGGNMVQMNNWGTGDTNYRFWNQSSLGTTLSDTSVYRDGGAQDEVTPYSMKMSTAAGASWPGHVLRSPPIIARVAASVGGVPDTVTVHIAHDGASAFTDKEVWLEVEALGNSGFPMSAFYSDAIALATGLSGGGTSQASSSETWTGDSGTGPNGSSTWNLLKLEKSSINFAETGYVIATVCMAVPSKTLYACPKLTVA